MSARAQEAAAVILQIISREHAILLKITRLRRGAGNARYCTLRPLFSRTCAHTRPRDTRGFRYDSYEPRQRCKRKPLPADEGASPMTIINCRGTWKPRHKCRTSSKRHPQNRMHLIVYSNRHLSTRYITSILAKLKDSRNYRGRN